MLGQTVEAKSPLSKGAIYWLLLGVALAAAGFATGISHYWMAAALPLVTGIVFWRNQAADVVITLEEKGIVLYGTQHTLSYDEIKAVFVGTRLLSDETTITTPGPITIAHENGRFFLPEKMNVSAIELGQFLVSRIPPQPEKKMHASLVVYANEQLAKFGADKVKCIHQREAAYQAIERSALATFSKALLISGSLWFVAAMVAMSNNQVAESFATWLALGIMAIFLGFTLWLLRHSRSKVNQIDIKKHGPACLVIGPAGLGLAQAELQGKLRWEEIVGIKNGPSKSFGGDNNPALHVSFTGGNIMILDIYDRSLVEIASLINKNTRPPMG